MTAWQLGEGSQADTTQLAEEQRTALSFIGKLVEFIPADVIALYAALTTAFEADPAKAESKVLIATGVLLCLIAVPLGAFSKREGNPDWFTITARGK